VGQVAFSVVDAGSPEARWAMRRYFEELDRRFDDGFVVGDALDEAVDRYNEPSGAFVLAALDGETVGCGAIVHLDQEVAEVKRMWVSPAHRGAGLGRRLLARLEDEVRAAGRTTVVLDTNGSLSEAIALYEAAGYRPTDRYNDNPYAQHWFKKELA
jgi:GNAT superfamily N-acetyltransferase